MYRIIMKKLRRKKIDGARANAPRRNQRDNAIASSRFCASG
jgi:hypothetical protein